MLEAVGVDEVRLRAPSKRNRGRKAESRDQQAGVAAPKSVVYNRVDAARNDELASAPTGSPQAGMTQRP
jgi:hypothetical protein